MGNHTKEIKNRSSFILNGVSKVNLVLFFVTFIIIALFIILSYVSYVDTNYRIGDTARNTVISEHTFSYFDKADLKQILDYIERSIPYYYTAVNQVPLLFEKRLNEFFEILKIPDDQTYLIALNKKRYSFSKKTFQYLNNNRFLIEKYKNRFQYVYYHLIVNYTIVDQIPETSWVNHIILQSQEGSTNISTAYLKETPLDYNELLDEINRIYPGMSKSFREAMSEILINIIPVNAKIDIQKRHQTIETKLIDHKLKKIVKKNEILVKKGEQINAEKLSKLVALREYQEQQAFRKIVINIVLSLILYTSAIYYFSRHVRQSFTKKRNIYIPLIFFILINLVYLGTYFLRGNFPIPIFLLIPFGILSIMLPVLLRDNRVAVVLMLFFALFILFYPIFHIIAFLNLLIIALSTVFTSPLLRNRTDFFKVGTLLSLIQIVFSIIYHQSLADQLIFLDFGLSLAFSFGNAFTCSIISLGLLPIFENIFNIPTRFRILELSNPATSPLLKELKLKAPGTYSHSMLIGDMAEEAAELLKLDSMMVKVGAYYHDIGKMENPQFFIENQEGKNPHEDFKPTISVSVIKSHVKNGVELAKQYNIPEEIIDFIREHHGTTTISYFYHQATELFGDENINIEDYKYPGPRPQSPETALVHLADSIEATVRAYTQSNEKFSLKNLQEIIDNTLKNRLEQGQFEECDITMRELNIAAQSYFKFLSKYYHRRIEYGNK